MPKRSRPKNKKRLWLIGLSALLIAAVAVVIALVATSESRSYKNPETYIGLTESEATRRAEAGGLEYRVVARDDEPIISLDDLRPNRINFSIANDQVYKAKFY
jgi:cytochrome c-type biogenesis protein CcmE